MEAAMAFRPDHPRFECLTDAFLHVLGQHAVQEDHRVWDQTASGLVYLREVPGCVFRGECGEYPTTKPSVARLPECHELAKADVMKLAHMSDWIAARLREEREELSWAEACALLQHYGMPSRIVDFTGDLGLAFAFAAHGRHSTGRLAILPYAHGHRARMLELYAHPWAERAQRQAAFGVVMDPHEVNDLKADAVRTRLNIKWYEFDILPSEKEYCEKIVQGVLRERNDPSAGFIRHYINLYVEAFGKLSPKLTEWLLGKQGGPSRIPIAPHCYFVDAVEERSAVVYFRGADALPEFNEATETERSRRYWSIDHGDRSEERIKDGVLLSPGVILWDPRTYHPDRPA